MRILRNPLKKAINSFKSVNTASNRKYLKNINESVSEDFSVSISDVNFMNRVSYFNTVHTEFKQLTELNRPEIERDSEETKLKNYVDTVFVRGNKDLLERAFVKFGDEKSFIPSRIEPFEPVSFTNIVKEDRTLQTSLKEDHLFFDKMVKSQEYNVKDAKRVLQIAEENKKITEIRPVTKETQYKINTL